MLEAGYQLHENRMPSMGKVKQGWGVSVRKATILYAFLLWILCPWKEAFQHHESKVKQSDYTPWRWRGEGSIAPTYSWPQHFMGVLSASCPGHALLPVPIGQEAWWAPEPVWTQRLAEKSFWLCQGSNLNRPVVQSIVRHYTDWAKPAPAIWKYCYMLLLHQHFVT
jgi:hypothetical protein